jgi:protein phosphatase
VGRRRAVNEDQFLIADLSKTMFVHESSLPQSEHARRFGILQGRLFVVADGMGGVGSGQLASSVAVDALAQYVLNVMPWFFRIDEIHEDDLRNELKAAMARCQTVVREAGAAEGAHPYLGTTLTMAYVIWPRAYVVHVGDTRCHLYRDSKLLQVTTDHSVAQRLADANVISSQQVESSRWKDVLWNAIGGDTDALSPQVCKLVLREDDALVLSTDGVRKHLPDDGVAELLQRGLPPEQVCRRALDRVNAAGGTDNVTMIVARFLGVETSDAEQEQAATAVATQAPAATPGAAGGRPRRPPDAGAQATSDRKAGRATNQGVAPMRRMLGFVIVLSIAAAYGAGYWPERQRRIAAEGELRSLRASHEAAETRVRLGRLLGQSLALRDVVVQRNYGQAQALATEFFDQVRAESTRTVVPGFRDALEAVLRMRDPVTASLAQADPAVSEHLLQVEARLKAALGFASVPTPPAAPLRPAALAPTPEAMLIPRSPRAPSPS